MQRPVKVMTALVAALVVAVSLLMPATAEAQYVDPGAEVSAGGASQGGGSGTGPAGSTGGAGELVRTGSWKTTEQLAVGAALVTAGGLIVYGVRRRQAAT